MLPTILGNFVKGDPGLVWRGDYDSTAIYVVNDVVGFDGGSYVAILPSVGVPVTNGDHWDVLARRGVDGSGVGMVASVNGMIGEVVLEPADIGAATDVQGLLATTAVQAIPGKGLSSNDFTANEKNKLSTIQQGATVNDTDANLRNRANHTGSQSIATIDGLQTTLSAKVDAVAGKVLSSNDFTSTEKTKLDTVATGATLNDTDANLKNRANHTGTQAIATVDGLQTAIDSKVNFIQGKGLSTNDYTTAEKTKLGTLDTASFRGSYVSFAALTAALPTARAGDYAFVDNAGTPAIFYIWRTSDNTWQQGTSTSSPTSTPAQIKSLYESNANTNAYVDSDKAKLAGVATAATANDTDANLKNRANHTGTQAISTVSGLQTALDAKVATVSGKGLSTNDYSVADQSKLAGIATGATANSTDAALRDRSTHTGTQTIGTITSLQTTLDSKVAIVTGKGLSTNDYTTAEQSKLSSIAPNATANSTDALLRDRSTHTGVQAISTVTGLQAAIDGKVTSVNGKTGSAITITASELGAATSAQGSKADSAVQSVNGKSGTSITLTSTDVGAATSAQGSKADTAVQPAALNTALANKASINDAATSGSTVTYSVDKIQSLLAAAQGPIVATDAQLAASYPAASNQYRNAIIINGAAIKAYLISDGTNWLVLSTPTTVYSNTSVTPVTTSGAYVRGINLSGMEYSESTIPGSAGTNYFLPTLANFQYWKNKGFNVIRLPVLLARWFDTPGGALNSTGKSQIDLVQGYANQTGMQIVLDGHDYAKRYVSGAQRQLGSNEYPVSAWTADWAKVAAYIEGKTAFYGIDFVNEPNGLAIMSSEFNYYPSRPFKQLMRDPQRRNPSPDLNWFVTTPYTIANTGGTTGGGRMSWNASNVFKDAIRHRNGTGNDGGDTLVAGQQYTVSLWYQSTATAGTHVIAFGAGNYPNAGGTSLGQIALPANTARTRVSLTFTMPAGQTQLYYNYNMQGFTGVGYDEDWNITEGATLRDFVAWSSDGNVATITTITNQAIAAVRAAGYTGWLLWEGDRATGLMDFGDNYGFWPDIPWVDSLNKTQMSFHHYLDYSGAYTTTWTQAARDRMEPAVRRVGEWAKAKSVTVFMGEYGVPSDSSTSSANYRTDFENSLKLYDEYKFNGTYWAAGDGFSSITTIGPVNGADNTVVLPIVVAHGPSGTSTTTPTTPTTGVPSNAVTYNGSPVTYNGDYVTYGA